MSIRINVYDEAQLKAALAQLPERMLDWASEVLYEQARLIAALAQIYVPVDTGSLRDSIRVERGGSGLGWRLYRVRAGGYVTNPRTGRKVDYAVYVEARFGFMAQAVGEVQPTIAEMIQARVVEEASQQ